MPNWHPKVLRYPRAPAPRRRLPAVDLPMPGWSRAEVLVVLGITVVLLAILVPVVHMTRKTARFEAEMYRRQQVDPLMLEE